MLAFVFSLIALTLMGPLGVLPRCVAVAQGAFHQVMPSIPLIWLSFGLCVAIYFLTANRNKIIIRYPRRSLIFRSGKVCINKKKNTA